MSEDQVKLIADLVGLRIDPAHLPGVLQNLEVVLAQAALLHQAPLDARIEPAPVFRP